MTWTARFQQALAEQQRKQAYRCLIARRATQPPYLERNGKRYLNFGGNDYLGLSHDPEIICAWQQALSCYGIGSGGSPLVSGHTEAHATLEQQLQQWLGYERALLFSSGYSANQAVLLGLLRQDDILLADKLCHASMQEAAALSPALYRRFTHQRYDILAQQLETYADNSVLIASEGVFSMDGDCADIPQLCALSRRYGALLLLDDAHGIGILGEEGRGSAAAAGEHPDILIITFGKAVGSMGAAVLCNHETAEYLTQFARHLIYSTAIPPAQAVALSTAFQRIREADGLRAKLQQNITRFRAGIRQLGMAERLLPSQTAIQPLICGSNQAALDAAEKLSAQGLYVPAIRPPTVPQGQARLRITLTAAHEAEHIDALLQGLHYAV
ncbi:8-amino-7-oxononanoate synthase [Neisseria sp. S1]|uniref:8-amino-7-oxononanoate synthase n=1 Tax=Neisseria sp. S1 TaxID=3318354 RepID=UPI003A876D5C